MLDVNILPMLHQPFLSQRRVDSNDRRQCNHYDTPNGYQLLIAGVICFVFDCRYTREYYGFDLVYVKKWYDK